MASYCLERAKYGRSKCKGKCKEEIPKGAWRLGSSKDGMTYFRCLPCITPRQLANIEAVLGSISNFVRSQTDIPEAEQARLERLLIAMSNGDEATEQALLTELENESISPPTVSKLKIKVPLPLDAHSPEAQAMYARQADLLGHHPPTSTRNMKNEPICFPEDAGDAVAHGFTLATPASMMPPDPALSSRQPPAVLPAHPALIQPTPLEMLMIRAVAALGTPDRNQVHDYARERLGAEYRKGGVTGAITRCISKGLLRSVYPTDDGGQPSKDMHFQCETLGLNLMALQDAKQVQFAQQHAGIGSASPAPARAPVAKSRKSTPTSEHSRIERALAQPMHCQHETFGGTQDCPRGIFAVQGSKGNVYEVQFGIEVKKSQMELMARCSCPDNRSHARSHYCKHLIFVAVRVLQVPMSEDQPLSPSAVHGALLLRMSSALPMPSLPTPVQHPPVYFAAPPLPPDMMHPASPTHSLSGLPLSGAPDLLSQYPPISDFTSFDPTAMPAFHLIGAANFMGDYKVAHGPSALPSSPSSPMFGSLELNPHIIAGPVPVLAMPNRKTVV